MKLLLDALLVFLVMLVAAAFLAWDEPGDAAHRLGTSRPANFGAADLAVLLGLR